jgi:hypothetical protein
MTRHREEDGGSGMKYVLSFLGAMIGFSAFFIGLGSFVAWGFIGWELTRVIVAFSVIVALWVVDIE